MADQRSVVLITGISGNLGLRLIPQLQSCDLVGVDIAPPSRHHNMRFAGIDIGRESSCRQLVELMRETRTTSVVHLAFERSVPTDLPHSRRMWQTNVAGTARVMEAITELNRSGGTVSRFLFTSGAFVYGPHIDSPALETSPLVAGPFGYALHQRAADETAQYRASTLGRCASIILRPAIYVGTSVENYFVDALRGAPTGTSRSAERLRKERRTLAFPVPYGQKYLRNFLECVHIDDVARLIAHSLRHPAPVDSEATILNVAGRDGALPLETCEQMIPTKFRRLPGMGFCSAVLRSRWKRGLSATPPEVLPYLIGSRPLDTTRLRRYLGSEYSKVIQYSTRQALQDCFARCESDSDPAAVQNGALLNQ